MNRSCELQAVVVSTDRVAADSLSSCLDELGITPAVHCEISPAMKLLSNQKTDAFFIDYELDPEFSLLRQVRSSSSSRGALAFALVPQSLSANHSSRLANFVMDKPLARARVIRTLRAAYGIMLKERMKYFRHSLDAEATVVDSMQRRFRAHISNISQTGVGLVSTAPLMARESVQLLFCLPGDEQAFTCKAQIIWTADHGKAGLTFTHVNRGDKARLTEWIESRFLREWQPLVSMGKDPSLTTANARAGASN